jgi:HSP90 family molecular chaperone
MALTEASAQKLRLEDLYSLTGNIFSKETRFVYELIQNADDNKYQNAESRGELPTATFLVSRDRIVIDLNEDGFNKANIRAICSIGASTKSNSQGYVGEKGIGFKSVFRVAHKVHIQSGYFSFAFEYRLERDATGLEMVTPIIQEHVDLPNGVGTRITLDVLEDYDREDLFQQFEELPDTLLLFLRKLKVLKFSLKRSESHVVEISYRLESDPDSKWLTVHKTSDSEITEIPFMTFRETITDMPEDKFRMFKRSEDSEFERISEAEVVLAFPIDEDEEPIIEDQDVFAFLPLRPAGFKV